MDYELPALLRADAEAKMEAMMSAARHGATDEPLLVLASDAINHKLDMAVCAQYKKHFFLRVGSESSI